MIRRASAALAASALAVGLAGCGGFDRLDFTYDSAGLGQTIVSFEEIQIPVGVAVGVQARPIDGDEVMDEETLVYLDSKNPGVLGIGQQDTPDDEESSAADNPKWKFVVYGVSVGTTQVTVTIDGEIEAEIPATVSAQ